LMIKLKEIVHYQINPFPFQFDYLLEIQYNSTFP